MNINKKTITAGALLKLDLIALEEVAQQLSQMLADAAQHGRKARLAVALVASISKGKLVLTRKMSTQSPTSETTDVVERFPDIEIHTWCDELPGQAKLFDAEDAEEEEEDKEDGNG